MHNSFIRRILVLPLISNLGSCGEVATCRKKRVSALVRLFRNQTLSYPTVNIAPAKRWSPGTMPKAAPGLSVTVFAAKLDHPRWLYVFPNGHVLVAETKAPPKREDSKGVKSWMMINTAMVSLVRDTNGGIVNPFHDVVLVVLIGALVILLSFWTTQ